MGFKEFRKRFTASIDEIESERLQGRFKGVGLTPIGELPNRTPVRLRGEIQRMCVVPRSGSPTLEIIVRDGTGELTAVFTGRASIGGLGHGRAIELAGVSYPERGRRVILNPAYTLIS